MVRKMTLEGITPGDPKRVFEALRLRLVRGNTTRLLDNSAGDRLFERSLFDLSTNPERFLVVAGARFSGCAIVTRPAQVMLFVDVEGREIAFNSDALSILGGGQAVSRVLFSVLKNCAAEDRRIAETTQTLDLSQLNARRIYLRKLRAVGDIVVGAGQTLVVDQQSCTFFGDVILQPGAKIEGAGNALQWSALRARGNANIDFEQRLAFNQDGEQESVVVVPRNLDFREGFPNEISISDAVVAGDILLRPGQTLIVRPSILGGRRASVLVRGRACCEEGTPRIIGDLGFHGLGRRIASLGPIVIGAGGFSTGRVG